MSTGSGQNDASSNVGIVGGGKVGLQLFLLFSQSSFTQVSFVVDRDLNAPAMAAAKQKGVAVFTDLNQALQLNQVDFIFEVTGAANIVEQLKKSLSDKQTQLITHDMAFILLRVIDEGRQRTTNLVRSDLLDIQAGITGSLETISGAIDSIKETTNDMRYLAVNARIEAAHAGEFGQGFDIVAQQVERSAQDVRDMTGKIESVNAEISTIAGRIDASLRNLR
jgi:methyl-accepting chemotaxis protein